MLGISNGLGFRLLDFHYLLKYKSAYETRFGKDAALILHTIFGDRMKSEKAAKQSMKHGLTFTVKDNPWIPMDNIYLSPAFGYIRVEGLGDNIKGAIDFLNGQMLNFKPTKKEFEKALVKVSRGGMMGRHGNSAKKKYVSVRDSILYDKPAFGTPNEDITYEDLLNFAEVYFARRRPAPLGLDAQGAEGIHARASRKTCRGAQARQLRRQDRR